MCSKSSFSVPVRISLAVYGPEAIQFKIPHADKMLQNTFEFQKEKRDKYVSGVISLKVYKYNTLLY